MMRIGLIGAGYMMQVTHLMSLRAIDGIELVAIADLDTALADRVAHANGIARVYPRADVLVEREAHLDAVVRRARQTLRSAGEQEMPEPHVRGPETRHDTIN